MPPTFEAPDLDDDLSSSADDDLASPADDERSPPAGELERAAMSAVYPGVDLGLRAHLDEHGAPRIVTRRFVVDEAFAGQRLDHYLKRMIPRLSRTRLQELIRTQ